MLVWTVCTADLNLSAVKLLGLNWNQFITIHIYYLIGIKVTVLVQLFYFCQISLNVAFQKKYKLHPYKYPSQRL